MTQFELVKCECAPIEQRLDAVAVVTELVQRIADGLHRHISERRRVAFAAFDGGLLAEQCLDHVANGHATRNGVRIHDEIGRDALLTERHVLLAVEHTARALLTVTRRKLVADLRHADGSNANLRSPRRP
jgi:hypothetical protein